MQAGVELGEATGLRIMASGFLLRSSLRRAWCRFGTTRAGRRRLWNDRKRLIIAFMRFLGVTEEHIGILLAWHGKLESLSLQCPSAYIQCEVRSGMSHVSCTCPNIRLTGQTVSTSVSSDSHFPPRPRSFSIFFHPLRVRIQFFPLSPYYHLGSLSRILAIAIS